MMITDLKKDEKTIAFENREHEIELMAETFLQNMKKINDMKIQLIEPMSTKLSIVNTCQMWGSGKTWLGFFFLQKLLSPKMKDVASKLINIYGEECFDALTNCNYLYIDFKMALDFPILSIEEGCKVLILRALLSTYSRNQRTSRGWRNESLSQWDLATIFREFRGRYFIHFDELDYILEFAPQVRKESYLGAVKRFAQFWHLIYPILLCGHFVYCSGRSSHLYFLAEDLYSSYGLKVPGHCVCIILNPLKSENILSMLHNPFSELKNMSKDNKRLLSEMIFTKTNGIPRLVSYTLQYLERRISELGIDDGFDITLFGKNFREFLKITEGTAPVLHPSLYLNPTDKGFYLKLIPVAALQIPFDMEALISLSLLNNVKSNDNSKGLMIPGLEFLRLFNLFIQRTDHPKKCYIIFPRLILEEILEENSSDPTLHLISSNYIQPNPSSNALLEKTARKCLQIRLINECLENQEISYDRVFPFLKHSFFAKQIIKSKPIRRFPKIVVSKDVTF